MSGRRIYNQSVLKEDPAGRTPAGNSCLSPSFTVNELLFKPQTEQPAPIVFGEVSAHDLRGLAVRNLPGWREFGSQRDTVLSDWQDPGSLQSVRFDSMGICVGKANWLHSSPCFLVSPQGVGPASRNSGLHNITFRYDSK